MKDHLIQPWGLKFIDYYLRILIYKLFAIQTQIENTIKNFEPRVSIESVNVIPDPDAYDFNVSITYNIVGIRQPHNNSSS